MAFFLPSSLQKRLLRYALTQAGFIRADELDLDNLDIVWGKLSSVELKGVGLDTDKIGALLQLPSQLKLDTATIIRLRLTVPADIYSSSIVVDIDGVDIAITATLDPTPTENETIPTVDDLAKSFIQMQPDIEQLEYDTGVGTPLGLPAFLSDFLTGIVNRLKVTVSNVQIRIDLNHDELGHLGLLFQAEELEMPSVEQQRKINLKNIKGSLTCDPALFESLQKGESTPRAAVSPSDSLDSRLLSSVTESQLLQSSVAESQLLQSEANSETKSDISSDTTSRVAESQLLRPESESDSSSMTQSVITQDHERFADPEPSHDGRFDDVDDDELDASMAQSIFGHFQDYDQASLSRPTLAASSGTLPLGGIGWLAGDEQASLQASTVLPSASMLGNDQETIASTALPSVSMLGSNQSSEDSSQASTASLPASVPAPASHTASISPSSGDSTPLARSESGDSNGDLLESKLFSHEEAESMYMSAMSFAEPAGAPSRELSIPNPVEQTVPGGWGELSTVSIQPVSTIVAKAAVMPLIKMDYITVLLPDNEPIELQLGEITVAADIAVCRIAATLASSFSGSSNSNNKPASDSKPTIFRIDCVRVNFVESLTSNAEILLQAKLDGISIAKSDAMDLKIGKFTFGYAHDDILFFEQADMQASMQASTISQRTLMQASLRPSNDSLPDIHLYMQDSKIELTTRPVHVMIDLFRLDETFTWLTGFSSMLSSSTPSKSVHVPTINVKAHIGGVLIDLVSDHSIQLRSTPIEAAVRGGSATARISVISIAGPMKRSRDPPMLINLCELALHYRPFPEKNDLDRLMALTLSDDILLDTLLRQRRQGARIKLQLSEVSCEINDIAKLEILPSMLEDIAKLGTVAKYLPDDERPGILSLVDVDRVRLYIDILGDISVDAKQMTVAHVGVPLLLAFSLSSIDINRGEQYLLGDVLSSEGAMIRFRLIGDEPEPTLKIKLYNLRIEYYVNIVMEMLNLKEATTEDMINSVPALKKPSRTWHLDVSFRDCVLGLNPQGQPSKALLLLSKVNVLTSFGDSVDGELAITKTSLMVIDDMANAGDPPGPEYPISRRLSEMGFVTVTTISSARANLRFSGPVDDRQIDIQLSDDLLVVESCADSTRTLIDLAGGLTPPLPKSTALQYRTEVMPVQDMLESLTGDAFTDEEWEDPFNEHEESSGDLVIQESHFSRKGEQANKWDSVRNAYVRAEHSNLKKSPLRVRITDVHIIWNLFDGYDWAGTRTTISKAVKKVEEKAVTKRNIRKVQFDVEDDESEIGDFLFNSIYIGIPANREPHELTEHIEQELESPQFQRSRHHKMTFELKGVSVDFLVYPPGDETQSMLDLRVADLDIFDHVPTSTWRKFATYMRDAGERETGSSQIRLELLTVRPIAELAASELVLKVTVLPLRLHVDQDALDFVTRFFEFKTGPAGPPPDEPFLQRVEVNSVRLKLDYKPKKVDYAGLRSGSTLR